MPPPPLKPPRPWATVPNAARELMLKWLPKSKHSLRRFCFHDPGMEEQRRSDCDLMTLFCVGGHQVLAAVVKQTSWSLNEPTVLYGLLDLDPPTVLVASLTPDEEAGGISPVATPFPKYGKPRFHTRDQRGKTKLPSFIVL